MAEKPSQKSAGRLVAVVVTHDRPDQLRVTLDALLADPPAVLAAVLIVDNASDPAHMAWLEGVHDTRLKVLCMPENRGGAGGFRAGMQHALAHLQPDWLVLMDDDAHPEAGTLARFRELDLAGWDAVAAAVRHPDGTLCEMNRPTLNPFRRPRVLRSALLGKGRDAFHMTQSDFAQPGLRAVDGASFVGFFIARHVIERIGYPDGALFLYADDAIYTQAMTAAGFRLAFAPELRFCHNTTTFTLSDARIRPMWKVYYYHRNLIFLYRQVSGRLFWPVLMVYLPRWAARAWLYRGERRVFLRLFWRAVRDGLARRTGQPHAEIVALSEPDRNI